MVFRAALVVCLLVTAVVASTTEEADASLPPPVEIFDPTPRPLGPISVIGDSVLRGALVSPPNLVDRLAEQGWGPIRALGVPGLSTGHAFRSPELTATFWFDRWREQGWDPKAVVLIVGSNDVGLCAHFDSFCMRGSLQYVADYIGPDRDLFIPRINHFFKFEWADPWNAELERLVAEREHLHTWAWDVELATGGYELDDVVHLSANSYRRWSQLTAREVTIDLARSQFSGDNVSFGGPTGAPSGFVTTEPERLADTRIGMGERITDDTSVLRIALGDAVPDDATAASLYVASVRSAADGFLQVASCGDPRPTTSVVNFSRQRPQGAATIVPVGDERELCVYSSVATDVVVDLHGVFAPGSGSGFDPTTPTRRVDTRTSGRTRVVEVAVDADATAVALNLTATNAATAGFLTAYPCGQPQPEVATLNYAPGAAVASSTFVATDDTNSICVAASTSVDTIIDQTGTFSDGSGLRYVPIESTRILDTRTATGGWSPFLSHHAPIDVTVGSREAEAVSGTITIVRPFGSAFATAYGCGEEPGTSSVNASGGAVVANALTVAASASGRLCVSSSTRTHAVVDVTGWWIDT